MITKTDFIGFFQDLTRLFGTKRVLGVDIGTVSVKMVELNRKQNQLILENYAILETSDYLDRSNEAIQTSSLKIVEKEVAAKLAVLLTEIKPQTKNVIASLPLFSVFIAPLEMPLLSPAETAKAVNFQARQYVPLPISEVVLDWLKTAEFDNARGQRYQRLLLIAVPNELIKKYQKIFKAVGLKLIAAEIESIALCRALLSVNSSISAIVDIGAESTSITLTDKGEFQYGAQIDYGGVSLTQALARSLDITPRRAEELKRHHGLAGLEGELELSTSIMPFLDVIIQEIRRVCGVYEKLYQQRVEKVILVGGGADLIGIEEYFRNQLGLIVESPTTLARLKYPSVIEPVVKNLNRELAVAVGTALKYYY